MTKVVEALKNIVQQKKSGRLIVRDAVDSSVTWEAYFGNGNLHFATSLLGQQERLIYLTNHHHPYFNLSNLVIERSDYQFICDRWQSGQFSLQQARQLALTITQEALVQMIAIDEAHMMFKPDDRLDPLIVSTSVQEIIRPVEKRIGQWQKIRPQINSPFVRIYLSNVDSLYQLLWQQLHSTKAIESYQAALTQNNCLYSIATQLNIDILELSYLLRSLIQNHSVQISDYGQQQLERPTIAYLDTNLTMQNVVKLVLESQGYQVMSLIKPAAAIDHLTRTRPTLILMDISMPNFDGHECCQLLRKSPNLKNVPILMLGNSNNLLDRVRSKLVGANDYIPKPITPKNLANIVNKQVSQLLVNPV
jgi:twitching motility two-component system response regulator PilG